MPSIITRAAGSARGWGWAATIAASGPTPGALWSWGNNTSGQLGLGNLTNYSSPKQLGSLTTWFIPAQGIYHNINIKSNGTLWSWGNNNEGQLGLGTSGTGTYKSSPTQVGALTNWSFVSAGNNANSAIKTDGTLWGWGNGASVGYFGTSYSSPKQIGASTDWATLSNAATFAMAVKTDGTLWTWGTNGYGQLGNGTRTTNYNPAQIGALTNWLYATTLSYTAIATKTDGTLWTWGYNNEGELGAGTSGATSRSSPVQVGSLTNWYKKSSGSSSSFSSIILKTNGTLWAWGSNTYGQLGNNTSGSNVLSPVQIGALTTWLWATLGQYSSGASKTDGTIWTWGYNNRGQLGLGNTTYYSSPKQVGSLTTWLNISSGSDFMTASKP